MSGTLDEFLGGRIKLIQPSTGYRAGIDPIFLSASLQPKENEKILDVGCGVGTASIAISFRCPHVNVTGIEIQPDLCELALQNIQDNNLHDRVEIIQGDILFPPPYFKLNMFDQVMTNPPYYEDGRTKSSPFVAKAKANTETMGLGQWIKCCLRFLKPKGVLTMIHRADRLAEILTHFTDCTGNIVVYPLWPGLNKPARRVIIQARKNARGQLRLAQGLVLHGETKKYTPEAEAILRHAQGIVL